MTPEEFKKLLKEFAAKQTINEADIIPIGPDGQQVTDKQVIKNLNYAVKAVDSTLRPKLIALITDPGAAKSLRTPAQRTALIGAMAIAFGITEKDFGQIVSKIKNVLKTTETTPNENPEA
jgi:hypothetical protein